MENGGRIGSRGAWWGCFGLAVWSVSVLGVGSGVALEAPPVGEQRIVITIRDSSFVRTKAMAIRAGIPTALLIRNEDPVTHGFISPTLSELRVRVEVDGVAVFGNGLEGLHLDPGKTAVIRLTPDRQGRVTFRCDLHPNVEGELYLLDVPVG